MTTPTLFSRVCAAGHRGAAMLVPLAPLLARLAFGQAFFITGLGKLGHLSDIVDYFAELGIPLPSVQAPIIASLEMVGGLALMAGVGTRLFAFLLSCTMVVAILTADGGKLLATLPFNNAVADVKPVYYLVALVWLTAYGAGPVSIDRIIAQKRGNSTAPAMQGTH